MADAMMITFDGREYPVEDFTLGELEWLEEQMGCTMDQIDPGSMKAAVRFVYLIRRRENPDFSLDDAREMKLAIFADDAGGAELETKDVKRRPTKRAA